MPPTITRATLLSAVRRGDQVAWNEFYHHYKGLVCAVARRLGLNENEIDDVFHEVMAVFYNKDKVFVYDRTKGHFKGYLKKITGNRCMKLFRKRKRTNKIFASGNYDLDNILAISEGIAIPEGIAVSEDIVVSKDIAVFEDIYEEEWKKDALTNALEDVKPTISSESYQIFHAVAIDHLPIEEAVKIFGKSANTIYGIKCRVAKKLKVILESYDE